MSLLSGILQSQAPPKQDATSTIQTLCLRLSTSTLLEDRRAAIMGLRSFARDYQELVASEGLRELISTLSKDREDLDTVKAVLETLLTLFMKDESNPESSEDIALWLTDEFTQKQENISVLLELLEDADFFIRLYTLQVLGAISENRLVRTQECVFSAPFGISRLCSILEDKRDAIRNEAVLLIIHLSAGHTDIQKLIAYESVFERVFAIIDMEGGVEGGIVVQDCLQLLSNLLSFNFSNQSQFRETKGIPRLAKLFDIGEEEPMPFAKSQRDTNIQYALRVVRLFVVPGGLGTPANQNALASAGILHLVLRVAFSRTCSLAIRADALKTVADLIDGNAPLQQGFAQMQVVPPEGPPPTENRETPVEYFVIEALLDLALLNSSIHAFDARLAACRCLEAYFNSNQPVREHFLRHAIELHDAGDESPNILTCLLHLDNESRRDPYRIWIATVVLIHLIYEDSDVKVLATSVKEGDAEAGEEEVTAIQSICANLITALQHHYDPRICVGYLMLLCIWLYEDSDAVDDFLNEGASVQSLVTAVKDNAVDPIVQGLSAFLLGILYEFSHRESPISRATLHPILSSTMGRDVYVNKITKFRSNPLIRDFEVLKEDSTVLTTTRKHGLPEIYFDKIFIDFFKDAYSQVLRAIDKDPGLETRVAANGVKKVTNGVSLELMDSLKSQLETSTAALEKSETARLNLEQQLQREQHNITQARESAAAEARKHRESLDAIKRKHDSDLTATAEKHRQLVEEMTKRQRRASEEKDGQILSLKRALDDTNRASKASQTEIASLKRQIEELGRRSKAIIDDKDAQLKEAERKAKAAVEERELQIQTLNRSHGETSRKFTTTISEKDALIQSLQKQLSEAHMAVRKADDVAVSKVQEAGRRAEERLKETETRLRETASWELQAEKDRVTELEEEVKKLKANEAKASDSGKKLKELEKTAQEKEVERKKAVEERNKLEQEKKDVQTELDDLFMVLGDLEEKRKEDKRKLKALGGEVSEDEEDDDDEDDEEDDDDDEDDDSDVD